MAFNFNISFGTKPSFSSDRTSFFYKLYDAIRGKRNKNYDKLDLVLNSPAVMFVFNLIAEYYAMGKYNSYVNNKLQQEDYLYETNGNPNQWQTFTDFDKNYIFSILLGNAYLYEQNGVMYFLEEKKIELTDNQREAFRTLTFSKYGEGSKKNIQKGSFKYKTGNKYMTLDLSKLWIIQDTSGVNGDWFAGISRLDALYEVVTNSNLSVSSETVNLEFSQKFLVSGQHDSNDVTSQMMATKEKDSLERNARMGKNMFATGSKVDLHHFVDNLANLKLDESYFNKVFIIAKMYNIPKDIIEMNVKGATWENQEKAMGRLTDYCLKPLAQKLTDTLENIYGLEDLRKEFGHLSFNKVFEQERENVRQTKIANLQASLELGLDASIVNQKIKELWELN
jgi:hypothetical protein